MACKRTACFTVKNDALFLIILELSVGMTTEGIEVRSVGNTKVSCTFGWLRNPNFSINFIVLILTCLKFTDLIPNQCGRLVIFLNTCQFLNLYQFIVMGVGGALGYFLGGYVPPGTPNWHPVLQKNSPQIYTPF